MELVNIFVQILLFFGIFYFGIPLNKLYPGIIYKKIKFLDNYLFNIIFYINYILVLSFFNLTINEILIIYLILLIILILLNRKHYLSESIITKSNIGFFSIIFMILFLISTDVANSLTLGWDAQKFWIYKSINFYENGTIENLKFLDKGDGYDYPYLGSLLWAIFWKANFFGEEYLGRLFYSFVYVASILSLTINFNASKYSKIILFFILILLTYSYSNFKGEQDILLFSLMAFAASSVIKISNRSYDKELFFNIFSLILICNLMIWTKVEGSVYAFIIILSLILCLKIKKKIKLILFLSFILLMILRILIYKFYNLNIGVNSCCWNDLSLSGIYSKITLERIFTIVQYFMFSLLKNYLIILSLLLLIISKNKFKIISDNLQIYLILGLCLCFIFTAYLLTDVNLIFMLKTGLDRLLFSISPFFITIIIQFLNSNKLELNS